MFKIPAALLVLLFAAAAGGAGATPAAEGPLRPVVTSVRPVVGGGGGRTDARFVSPVEAAGVTAPATAGVVAADDEVGPAVGRRLRQKVEKARKRGGKPEKQKKEKDGRRRQPRPAPEPALPPPAPIAFVETITASMDIYGVPAGRSEEWTPEWEGITKKHAEDAVSKNPAVTGYSTKFTVKEVIPIDGASRRLGRVMRRELQGESGSTIIYDQEQTYKTTDAAVTPKSLAVEPFATDFDLDEYTIKLQQADNEDLRGVEEVVANVDVTPEPTAAPVAQPTAPPTAAPTSDESPTTDVTDPPTGAPTTTVPMATPAPTRVPTAAPSTESASEPPAAYPSQLNSVSSSPTET